MSREAQYSCVFCWDDGIRLLCSACTARRIGNSATTVRTAAEMDLGPLRVKRSCLIVASFDYPGSWALSLGFFP
nr:hypothetical protein CFP56_63779 [Quercus suber]